MEHGKIVVSLIEKENSGGTSNLNLFATMDVELINGLPFFHLKTHIIFLFPILIHGLV
jgi:hypothetical protein